VFKKLAFALASKDNTMAKPRIYLRRKRPHFGSDVYERHIYYIYFNLLSSRLHMLYFAVFRCVTSYLFYFCPWPGQSFPPSLC